MDALAADLQGLNRRSQSLYWQGIWDITPALTLSAGRLRAQAHTNWLSALGDGDAVRPMHRHLRSTHAVRTALPKFRLQERCHDSTVCIACATADAQQSCLYARAWSTIRRLHRSLARLSAPKGSPAPLDTHISPVSLHQHPSDRYSTDSAAPASGRLAKYLYDPSPARATRKRTLV